MKKHLFKKIYIKLPKVKTVISVALGLQLAAPTSPQLRGYSISWERQVVQQFSSSQFYQLYSTEVRFQDMRRLTSSTQPPFIACFSNLWILGLWLFSQHLAHKGEVLCRLRQAEESEATASLQCPHLQSRGIILREATVPSPSSRAVARANHKNRELKNSPQRKWSYLGQTGNVQA